MKMIPIIKVVKRVASPVMATTPTGEVVVLMTKQPQLPFLRTKELPTNSNKSPSKALAITIKWVVAPIAIKLLPLRVTERLVMSSLAMKMTPEDLVVRKVDPQESLMKLTRPEIPSLIPLNLAMLVKTPTNLEVSSRDLAETLAKKIIWEVIKKMSSEKALTPITTTKVTSRDLAETLVMNSLIPTNRKLILEKALTPITTTKVTSRDLAETLVINMKILMALDKAKETNTLMTPTLMTISQPLSAISNQDLESLEVTRSILLHRILPLQRRMDQEDLSSSKISEINSSLPKAVKRTQLNPFLVVFLKSI